MLWSVPFFIVADTQAETEKVVGDFMRLCEEADILPPELVTTGKPKFAE